MGRCKRKEGEEEVRKGGGREGERGRRWDEREGREEAWIIHWRITTGLRQGGSQKYPWPRQLGAITPQRSTTRQQPLLLPVSVSSGSETLRGIIKSHRDVAAYSKTSSAVQLNVSTHASLSSSPCSMYITHRTRVLHNMKRGNKGHFPEYKGKVVFLISKAIRFH